MLKIDTLRAAISDAVPEIKAEPSRLAMWVEHGSAQMRQTGTLAFGYKFRLNALLQELVTDVSVVSLAIFIWLQVNQPELLAPGADGFAFDVDILDNASADVLFQLDLTQDVTVAPQPDGTFALRDLPEPDPLFDDFLGAGGATPVPLLTQISVSNGAIVLPDDAAR